MDDTSTIERQFPPNVPEKLIRKYLQLKSNQRALARELGVNPAHVNNLLTGGKEPKDKKIRKKLFLPAKSREWIPAWVIEATDNLARLEEQALPRQKRTYNRKGKRVT